MCGIVGATGKTNAYLFVLEGLKRLEYRGYDSAGISINHKNKLQVFKKEGKLGNLVSFLEDKNCEGRQAIGHTRWATHGKVNDINAHPHSNGIFSIVHNGIIENATDLKSFLQKEGVVFQSETDSEVFLQLLDYCFKKSGDLKASILEAFSKIEGNSAFVIQYINSDNIWALKKSAPLVCGTDSKNEGLFLSSDPYALVGSVDTLYFPEDNVLCFLDAKSRKIEFFEVDGTPSKRYLTQKPSLHLDVSTKGNFEHYMLKEIYEQPELILKMANYYFEGEGKNKLSSFAQKNIENIIITACGTAWHAGLLFKYYVPHFSKTRTQIELASEFRYQKYFFKENEIGLMISQSGETADTLACQELCHAHHIDTYSIINVEGSTIFRNAKENFPILAGAEIGVASTKAFTLQSLTGLLMAQALGGNKNNEVLHKEFILLAQKMKNFFTSIASVKEVVQKVCHAKGFIFTGRGQFYPIALEGALKLKEIAYVHAEGYAAGELKHGPIALIDDTFVNIALVGHELFDKTVSNIEEVKARKGIMLIVGPKDNERLKNLSDHYIGVDMEGLTFTAPLMANLVMQCFAYEIAKQKGTDIDQPRNLAKSVTVE
jgi:glucosamine--fructose-6-phosphate aminotransferase (isomerizing)